LEVEIQPGANTLPPKKSKRVRKRLKIKGIRFSAVQKSAQAIDSKGAKKCTKLRHSKRVRKSSK
jgi:hypothetical protein